MKKKNQSKSSKKLKSSQEPNLEDAWAGVFQYTTLQPQKLYSQIIEWLYLNDGVYPNKHEWRTEFIEMLKKELNP